MQMAEMTGRLEADSPSIRAVTLAAVLLLAAASFSLSVPGIMAAAEAAMIPEGLRWLVPVCIDATILVYSLAAAVQYGRGESTRSAWMAVGFFTAVSVACNASHVLTSTDSGIHIGTLLGAALAAIMPIGLFFATHTAIDLLVEKPTGNAATRRRKAAARTRPAPATASGGAASSNARPKRQPADPDAVLRMHRDGASVRKIAAELGMSPSTVHRITASAEESVLA